MGRVLDNKISGALVTYGSPVEVNVFWLLLLSVALFTGIFNILMRKVKPNLM